MMEHGVVWKKTRAAGMSLGDRACISLAMKVSVPAFTTEGDWLKWNLGVEVTKMRWPWEANGS